MNHILFLLLTRMGKVSMYPEDTFLKDIIHKLNNQLMKMKLNLEELREYIENNQVNNDFLSSGIQKQKNYISKFSMLLQDLKNEKTGEDEIFRHQKAENLTGRVLIVDDEQDLLNIMKRYLEKIGLTVEVNTNGEEALNNLKNKKYHYLITDLKMPGLDGQTLIKLGKENNLLEDTIVIAITGGLLNEYSEEQRNFLRENIDGFLQKPFSKDELYRLIYSFEP